MASELAQRLHAQFVQYDYRWAIGGELEVPTEEDLDKTLDKAKEVLYAEPVPSQMEVGHLIVRQYAPGKFDVYLHILGDIND